MLLFAHIRPNPKANTISNFKNHADGLTKRPYDRDKFLVQHFISKQVEWNINLNKYH